jgi:hypothetical protein
VPIAEWVQYHNTDKLGREPAYVGDTTGIFWTARRSPPVGARVWLVAGETHRGRKRYRIYDWFIVETLSLKTMPRTASGTVYRRFQPPIDITGAEWFPEFIHFMGNFGRGLSPLRPKDVAEFLSATT